MNEINPITHGRISARIERGQEMSYCKGCNAVTFMIACNDVRALGARIVRRGDALCLKCAKDPRTEDRNG